MQGAYFSTSCARTWGLIEGDFLIEGVNQEFTVNCLNN